MDAHNVTSLIELGREYSGYMSNDTNQIIDERLDFEEMIFNFYRLYKSEVFKITQNPDDSDELTLEQ